MDDPVWRVLEGDARDLDVEDGSVHVVLLSPPYWGLRRYLDDSREIGREDTLQEWVDNLVTCAREWKRVLRDDGTLWVNCGDAYASSGGDRQYGSYDGGTGRGPSVGGCRVPPDTLKPKDLIGLPWRLAFTLQADGWYLRSAICWAKGTDWLPNEQAAQAEIKDALQVVREQAGNSLFGLSKKLDAALKRAERAVDKVMTSGPCMPESVTDRVTSSYEMLFMFSKSERYYFDQTAIRVGDNVRVRKAGGYEEDRGLGDGTGGQDGQRALGLKENDTVTVGRNPRSVWLLWRVNTEPQGTFVLPSGEEVSHFASWPSLLVERILKAAAPMEGVCKTCGAPWERVERRIPHTLPVEERHGRESYVGAPPQQSGWYWTPPDVEQAGWAPTCTCHGSPIPGPVPCEHCRGTGREAIHRCGEQSYTSGTDIKNTPQRDNSGGMSNTPRVETGSPCPHCLCPDCGGTGHQRTSQQRTASHFPDDGQRESGKRGIVANLGENSMVETDDPCPTCHGLGSLGYIQGPVWSDDVLDNWPRVPATVLDPMAGSGTTGRVALSLGLSPILNDLNPQYCRLMNARLEAYPDDVPTKRRGDGDEEDPDSLPLFEAMEVTL